MTVRRWCRRRDEPGSNRSSRKRRRLSCLCRHGVRFLRCVPRAWSRQAGLACSILPRMYGVQESALLHVRGQVHCLRRLKSRGKERRGEEERTGRVQQPYRLAADEQSSQHYVTASIRKNIALYSPLVSSSPAPAPSQLAIHKHEQGLRVGSLGCILHLPRTSRQQGALRL